MTQPHSPTPYGHVVCHHIVLMTDRNPKSNPGVVSFRKYQNFRFFIHSTFQGFHLFFMVYTNSHSVCLPELKTETMKGRMTRIPFCKSEKQGIKEIDKLPPILTWVQYVNNVPNLLNYIIYYLWISRNRYIHVLCTIENVIYVLLYLDLHVIL